MTLITFTYFSTFYPKLKHGNLVALLRQSNKLANLCLSFFDFIAAPQTKQNFNKRNQIDLGNTPIEVGGWTRIENKKRRRRSRGDRVEAQIFQGTEEEEKDASGSANDSWAKF